MQKILVFLSFYILSSIHLQAQDQRFMGGVIVGLNASQIDGDNAAGYNKAGLMVGLRGGAYLTEKASLTVDMLYSQRGSRRVPKNDELFDPYTISTPYVEVPFLFHYKDWRVEYDDGSFFYKVSAEAGVAVSYLLQPKVENIVYETEVDNFNKIDLAWVLGVSYYFNENIGVAARYLRSVTPVYNHNKHMKTFNSLYGYNFNFSVFYVL
ncbi:MAG TPA: PorT family protein [Saprospiraceae bacterium]|nr:PorT family protein [Saprospiraceae bacterium]